MAAALPVMMAVSTGIQVLGAIQQGRAAADAANYNATINEQNAVIIVQSQRIARPSNRLW